MDYPSMERDSLFYKEFANHFDYRNKPWTAFVKAARRISQRLDVDEELNVAGMLGKHRNQVFGQTAFPTHPGNNWQRLLSHDYSYI